MEIIPRTLHKAIAKAAETLSGIVSVKLAGLRAWPLPPRDRPSVIAETAGNP